MAQETLRRIGARNGDDGLSPLAALVRQCDRDRFQAALFAPAAQRETLFALYAFNYEIARVREIVSEPMLGQIRLACSGGARPSRRLMPVASRGGMRSSRP
jgi:phytoene/squalene synthetase